MNSLREVDVHRALVQQAQSVVLLVYRVLHISEYVVSISIIRDVRTIRDLTWYFDCSDLHGIVEADARSHQNCVSQRSPFLHLVLTHSSWLRN